MSFRPSSSPHKVHFVPILISVSESGLELEGDVCVSLVDLVFQLVVASLRNPRSQLLPLLPFVFLLLSCVGNGVPGNGKQVLVVELLRVLNVLLLLGELQVFGD